MPVGSWASATRSRTAHSWGPHAEQPEACHQAAIQSAYSGPQAPVQPLFYRHCSGTCLPSLLLIRDAAAQAGGLGRDYRVLGLSFAESDTAEDMRAQAAALGLERDPHWLFAVARREDVQRIADALGFCFRRDLATGQYDHPTLLVAVDRGRVVRALLGYPISRERFRELVWEMRGAFVPYYQIAGQSWLRCFEYDGRTGAMRPDWGFLLLLAPGTIALLAALALFSPTARSPKVDKV
jgi:hypothetical protein